MALGCDNIEIIPCCFTPTNTSVSSVSLNKYVKLKGTSKVYYYATIDDPDSPIDPATYLGGGDITIGECPLYNQYYTEIYRLNGNLNVTSVPEIPIHPNNPTLQPLVEGNTVTITGDRKAILWRWQRETQQDSELDINSITYRAGSGPQYMTTGLSEFVTEDNGNFNYTKTFTAKAGAFVEIHVQRKIQ